MLIYMLMALQVAVVVILVRDARAETVRVLDRCVSAPSDMENCAFNGTLSLRDTDNKFGVGLIGRAFIQSGQNNAGWGIATEAWSAPGVNATLVGGELSIVARNHSSTAQLRGVDVVFKNRPDAEYAGYLHKGENRYNNNAYAYAVSSQPRSSGGEYSGWQAGLYFGKHSLDRSRDRRYTALIDYSEVEIDNDGNPPYMFVWQSNGVKYGMRFSGWSKTIEFVRYIDTPAPQVINNIGLY